MLMLKGRLNVLSLVVLFAALLLISANVDGMCVAVATGTSIILS